MIDRYTKTLLTVIAAALVYLCVVSTPLSTAHAQTAPRPGMSTGPAEMVIVGWRAAEPVPVAFQQPVRVTTSNGDMLRVTGNVATERASGAADRVVIVGWEDNADRNKPAARIKTFIDPTQGLPITTRLPAK